jgi:RNA polymerase sigma-70 factor, ECF subfamily
MTARPGDDIFLQLINSHKGIIVKIAAIYCRDISENEDLKQEIIYTLWKFRGKYDPAFVFSTWMYKVSLNVSITWYRHSKQRNKILRTSLPDIDQLRFIESRQEEDEDYQALHRAIAALNVLDKALMLLYLDDRSYKEISEVLGISETNVATKISRTKAKLKQQLQSQKQQ